MRAFFALIPDANSALQIEQWRRENWPLLEKPVPAANLHITLSFLGDINEHQAEQLCQLMQDAPSVEYQLTLDDIGYWDNSQVLFLAPHKPDPVLTRLASRCAQAAARTGIKVSKKRWQPHMTLARRVSLPPATALRAPDFNVSFDGFSLQQSILAQPHARYLTRAEF